MSDQPARQYVHAYYYEFELTGIEPIDAILIAVARAGKAYHNTQYWSDSDEWDGGPSYAQRIQDAADAAAKQWEKRR